MNLTNLKTPALIFLAGYFFFMIDHYHKAILNHAYALALVVAAVFITLQLQLKAKKDLTVSQRLNRPMIAPAQEQQTINVGQAEKVAR